MPDKVITSLSPNYHKLKGSSIFILLLAISFFIRLPFYFRDYIDRDESTFILIGQSWVEGHLPYTQLWDVKPPLTFLFFAVIIYIFGKSFIAIRFAGTLLVLITAFFTYKSTALVSTKKTGLWAAIGCVLLQSLFGSIQGVMSEHICMAFFMPSFFLLLKSKKYAAILFAGLLMGLCLMTKLNMAYAILFLGLYLFAEQIREKHNWKGFFNSLIFGVGILFIVLLTLLPYALEDSAGLWWKSVFLAPLDYAGARRYSLFRMAPVCIAIVAFFVLAWKRNYLNYKSRALQLLMLVTLGVVFSFVRGGRINSHYLIQLFPILVIPVSVVISKMSVFQKFNYRRIVILSLALLPMESYLEYYAVTRNKVVNDTFYNGEGFAVPEYILQNNLETENILFLGYHIGYWVLGKIPPTKAATHPSNLCKEEMFAAYDNPRKTAMAELRFIMEELRPKTVITRHNRNIFDKDEVEENEYIETYIAQYYKLHTIVENANIYQRLE